MISGNEILKEVANGNILINPFNKDNIGPISYDLTLGNIAKVYSSVVYRYGKTSCELQNTDSEGSEIEFLNKNPYNPFSNSNFLNSKKENKTIELKMSKDGFLLKPNIGYLMHTNETITTNKYAIILDGKSSIARLFITIHETALTCHPGSNGQITLEVRAIHPVWIYPNMKICQAQFHPIIGDITLYNGKYKDENAEGPIASRSFKQFKKD